jgi:hypothetical protein
MLLLAVNCKPHSNEVLTASSSVVECALNAFAPEGTLTERSVRAALQRKHVSRREKLWQLHCEVREKRDKKAQPTSFKPHDETTHHAPMCRYTG